MKDLKISKELLSEVLGHDDMCNERIVENKLSYMCKNDGMGDYEYEYNIYEFAFKCKEWAFSKGYTILTEFVNQNGIFSYTVSNKQSIENYGYLENIKVLNYIPHNKTEHEAIIKACEWILEKEIQEENRLQLQEDLSEYNKMIREGINK